MGGICAPASQPELTQSSGAARASGSPAFGPVRARERVALATAEGATAPESLRQKDRARIDTLESVRLGSAAEADHRRGNLPFLVAGKALRSSDRGGGFGESGPGLRRNPAVIVPNPS